jgi:hypothetical protein
MVRMWCKLFLDYLFTVSELHKLWCAVLGLNQRTFATAQGSGVLKICDLVALVVTWTLADLAGRTCPAKLRDRRRVAFDDADADLRRLIREGFERGIPGQQLAQSAELSMSRVHQIRDGRR